MRSTSLARLLNPIAIFCHLLANRRLILQFSKREFQLRFKKTFLGFIWGLLVPLLMLTVYTFVFSVVFQARWGTSESESRLLFAVILFTNLIVYNTFSEIVAASPGLIIGNVNLVKKVIFPLEILPVSRAFATFFQTLMSLAILLIAIYFVQGFSFTILYAPLILVPILVFSIGVSYFVSSLTVFVRDVGQFIGIILTLLLFLSPIFYPLSRVPSGLRQFVLLNPFTIMLEQFRLVMVEGQSPAVMPLLIVWVIALAVFCLGFAWFMKVKKSFADVL